jgi:hypothetical protein
LAGCPRSSTVRSPVKRRHSGVTSACRLYPVDRLRPPPDSGHEATAAACRAKSRREPGTTDRSVFLVMKHQQTSRCQRAG